MNPDDFAFIGIRGKVMALSKHEGRTQWSTDLPGFSGNSFVSLVIDGQRVLAYSHGQVHALEIATGRILWTNELPGCGYGFASIAVAGGTSTPNPQMVAAMQQRRRSNSAGTSGST